MLGLLSRLPCVKGAPAKAGEGLFSQQMQFLISQTVLDSLYQRFYTTKPFYFFGIRRLGNLIKFVSTVINPCFFLHADSVGVQQPIFVLQQPQDRVLLSTARSLIIQKNPQILRSFLSSTALSSQCRP